VEVFDVNYMKKKFEKPTSQNVLRDKAFYSAYRVANVRNYYGEARSFQWPQAVSGKASAKREGAKSHRADLFYPSAESSRSSDLVSIEICGVM